MVPRNFEEEDDVLVLEGEGERGKMALGEKP